MTPVRPGDPRSRSIAQAADLHQVEQTETVHHTRKRTTERGVRVLNLTAMLDVCFQLLIFFILTANFAIDEGMLPADLPQGVPDKPTAVVEPPPDPLVIRLSMIGDRCAIWARGRSFTDGDFEKLFDLLNGSRYDPVNNPGGIYEADNPIVIKPDGGVEWGYVVAAFNAVLGAQYTDVSFAPSG
jgi:biopolymer transport protein ExbD